MDRGMKTIIVLLILSLALNLFVFNRMQKTEEEFEKMRSSMTMMNENLNNTIANQDRYINNKLDEFVKENNWINNEEFLIDYDKTTDKEVHLNYQWSFKEVEEDANVYLICNDKNGNYIKEEATKQNNGIYTVSLILSPDNKYKYKITTEGSTLRVGEEKEIPEDYYKPGIISITSMSYEENSGYLRNFELEVTQKGSLISGLYKPVKLQVVIHYNNEKDTKELNIVSESLFNNVWSAYLENFKNKPEKIDLEIIYENGHIESNEIWPKDVFSEKFKSN
ncbi:MAG: hypothetical protein K0Q97_3114 [Bacillota bacterium]|jgi:hypothetical protein|nr:hypothetical protein [Bacillota bacterium]